MCGILQSIRIGTAARHARVEALVPVFSETFGFGDYVQLLERFYGFYRPFEKNLRVVSGLNTILPDWRERLKLPLLEQDLFWLGRTRAELDNLPVCSRLPPLDSDDMLAGALYVTEGSTLGGQIITRQLAKALSLHPGQGSSFFAGHGPETGSKWREFTAALCRIAAAGDESRIVSSAEDTFEASENWLASAVEQGGPTESGLVMERA